MSRNMEATANPPCSVIAADTVLGEGPLWCERTQTLWWIDGWRPQILRWREGEAHVDAWPQARPPAALALADDGRLFIAFRARFGVMAQPGAAVQDLPLYLDLGEERFNDAKVDANGRLWIGTIDRELRRAIGALRCFDDKGIHIADSGFALSNGIGWSPDGRQMYFAESHERHVHRYQCDPRNGCIARDGILASHSGRSARDHTGDAPKPDGLTVDAEGGIWCAIFGAGRVARYWPDGTLDRSIELPVSRPTSCIFGGKDMRTLFVTTARYGLTLHDLAQQPQAGSVFAFQLDVAGLPTHRLSEQNVLVRAAQALEPTPRR